VSAKVRDGWGHKYELQKENERLRASNKALLDAIWSLLAAPTSDQAAEQARAAIAAAAPNAKKTPPNPKGPVGREVLT
jgi:hypothetical protein